MSEPPSARESAIPETKSVHRRVFEGRAPLWVAVLGILAFLPTLTFGFVYDDRWTIVRNPWLDGALRPLLAALSSGTAHSLGIPDATRPAMVTSLWIDRRLFGLGAAGHHAHSLLLYGVTCAAAWFAAMSLLRDRRAAFVAAALFAVAPLHAEVVAAVNYREDLIAALGILVPLAYVFRPSQDPDSVDAGLGVTLVFGWGLLAKESAAVLLPLVLLLAAIMRVDRAWLGLRERTLFLLLSAFVLWLNWRLALTLGGDDIPRAASSDFTTRGFDTSRFLVRSVLASFGLSRPAPEFPIVGHARSVWLAAAVLVVLVIVALARSSRTRSYALGLTLSVVAPLGASPLVGPVNAWADRYFFVGLLGGAVCLGTALASVSRKIPERWGVAGLGMAAVAGCATCWHVARIWKSERSLWTYAVAVAPDSPRAWAALSRLERLDGNLDAADRLVEHALALNPVDIPARVTRIYNLLARGSVEAARREISYVDLIGGGLHPGMARARSCARMARDDAARCVRAN